ncbi:MAG: hypothetical protein H0X60_06170 [Chloroflexi bacterium]|nr:hypothetical protein [Chloroflexota bacterium]
MAPEADGVLARDLPAALDPFFRAAASGGGVGRPAFPSNVRHVDVVGIWALQEVDSRSE